MLTNEDIQKIMDAQKDLFMTKFEFENFKDEYKKDFSNLQKSVDAYAHKADGYFQEMVMLSGKVARHEKWLQQLAQKLDVKLEF